MRSRPALVALAVVMTAFPVALIVLEALLAIACTLGPPVLALTTWWGAWLAWPIALCAAAVLLGLAANQTVIPWLGWYRLRHRSATPRLGGTGSRGLAWFTLHGGRDAAGPAPFLQADRILERASRHLGTALLIGGVGVAGLVALLVVAVTRSA